MKTEFTNSGDILNLISDNRALLGRKPDVLKSGRLAEAQRLTELMNSSKGFSFGRIGDYEVALLLKPDEAAAIFNSSQNTISGAQLGGSPGLEPRQVIRLHAALERISYIDFHERLWKDNTLLDQLALKRLSGFRNPNWETSYILPTWLEHEFKNYCRGRRILFCGAEAPLLENLLKKDAFRECAQDFWPADCEVFFLRPREDGRNLSNNLDAIKSDLRKAIKSHNIDTLFLSLGGGAKILCCELAEELKICAIDFGVSLRSLTYSGSDGNLATRSTHSVFLYRVPFNLYMDSLEETYPALQPQTLLAKAHAQLLLEIQTKEIGWSHHAGDYDFRPSIMAFFYESFNDYKRRCGYLFKNSTATQRERADFLHFCGKHKLTFEGRLFLTRFEVKSALARIIGKRQ